MAIQKQHKKAGLDEKNSGNDRDLNAISDFRNVVQDCNLMDMGSQGYLFTWSNRRFGPYYIEEKLDRFLCSKDWADYFYNSTTTTLVNWSSDHNLILMEIKERSRGSNYQRRNFTRLHYEDI